MKKELCGNTLKTWEGIPQRYASKRREVKRKGRQDAHVLGQSASHRRASERCGEAYKTEGDSVCLVAKCYVVEEVVRRRAERRSALTPLLEMRYTERRRCGGKLERFKCKKATTVWLV